MQSRNSIEQQDSARSKTYRTGVSLKRPVPRGSRRRPNRRASRRRPHTPSRFPRFHISRRVRRPVRVPLRRMVETWKPRYRGWWEFQFPRFANFRNKSKKTFRLLEFQKSNAIRNWIVAFWFSRTGFQHSRKLPVSLRLKIGGIFGMYEAREYSPVSPK